ncbi:uncharacterized protein MELLADRAFT_88936 [Melampsora larici-populina 98AG31]|uniref:Uncharacterized protein n=1 Tax=Melampsora larici-populina (strain 98AG31 / pathotype 3-4-7) TaxID=747676 RepID=F4R6C3_MELLP|nr:uncharacterized protein MELLADRAFT_88936 [Melampsora larici-populina 98AG31]EGG11853.1 hypothetical protein MELLADRAFT_88936 [Melampsora larici-populina 98AG31]
MPPHNTGSTQLICGRHMLMHSFGMNPCADSAQLVTVKHLRRKKTEARQRLEEAEVTLKTLISPGDGCPGRDAAYLEGQWMAQRARHLDIIEESKSEKRDKISLLLELEEGLHVSLKRLDSLQNARRRASTQAERRELVALPGTVVDFEERIGAVANELGGNEFRGMLGVTATQTNAILAISIARGKMYEARVGVIEARLRQHRNEGTRQQQQTTRQCGDKLRNLRDKYNTYKRRVQKYHTDYPRRRRVELPDFDTIESMEPDDPFWNRGEDEVLPGEEAESERIRRGITAFLARRGAQEELRRLARESRHMMGWAIEYHQRIMGLKITMQQGPRYFHSHLHGSSN